MDPTLNQRIDDKRDDRGRRARRRASHRPSSRFRSAMLGMALVGLVVLSAGCGGAKPPGIAGGTGGSSPAQVLAQLEAYARCMRAHGIRDFPDPLTSPGGGVAFQINGGPGSDLDRNNPRFTAADHACQSLEPGRGRPSAQSATKIAAEVTWARCMRAHGLPSFPDPDSQGAFDSSKFDESTPAFQSASNACRSLMNAVGAVPVHPGSGR